LSLDRENARFSERTQRSKAIFQAALKTTPFGVHSNYRLTDPHPLYCARSKGSRIWDADHNEYIDFNMGFGALVVGHAHPKLVEALKRQVENGTLFGFESENAVKLAELMCRRFSVDMVKFSSTGLEATSHAIRLARACTGRRKILKFEGCYHGSHDSLLVSVKPSKALAGNPERPNRVPASQGIPESFVNETVVAPFNNIEAVNALMHENMDQIAGVILEPIPMNMGFVLPQKGFLEGLRTACDEYGCMLIFDEVKTCGKFYGGVEDAFHVKPDLKVMGKAVAGGLPLSVLAGKKSVMEQIVPGQVAHAGTFNANPLCVTAGIVTLSEILTKEKMRLISELGNALGKGCAQILDDLKVKSATQFLGLSGTIHFGVEKVGNWRDFLEVDYGKWYTMYAAMLNRGIIPMGTGPDEQWTVSVQHSKDDVEKYMEAFKEVAKEISQPSQTVPLVEAL
jgi:glutamate-1-semialdehyde 2,1-aminomutase